ncbi:Eco57I restriction-modification methylase domain-containing protein [Lujinxingia litoralis]|uniref:Eco57I restriction-modification methylase domain-containing protein n=1 Tax=Lujinxingia litoralis TaxID=2211119 RepID=UPI001314985A|nr:DNA methyltransferase [Lujinxingia litoralis]
MGKGMERVGGGAQVRALMQAGDVRGLARAMGYEVVGVEVMGAALRAWGLWDGDLAGLEGLEVVGRGEGYRLMCVRGGSWERARALMMKVAARSEGMTVVWWWLSGEAWTAAMVDDDEEGRRIVRRLRVDGREPDPVGLGQWWALRVSDVVKGGAAGEGEAVRRQVRDVLDQEGVTRAFFEGFSGALRRLTATMEGGPAEAQARHEVALGTLLRVVFLYFLQARGALDGDRRYVMRRLRREGRRGSFYREVMRPLFFGALNCPVGARGEEARGLGRLPFLNGGLFEATARELASPELDWPDEVWREVLEGVFERHRFVAEWAEAGDLSPAVDPEMLGKVFEGLMYGEWRGRSGSFYTPREVVRQMVGQGLGGYLESEAGLSRAQAQGALEGDVRGLDAEGRARLREALWRVRVLDPAVGTGAFLLEVLGVLRRVDRALDEAAGVVRTAGERYERMRRLIHEHLYGVDVQATAVRLCELRLWLAMLSALEGLPAEAMPALPNLTHRLCAGNSLLEPLDVARYRVKGEVGAWGEVGEVSREGLERLAQLEEAYTAAHGEEKVVLKRAMERAQRAVQAEVLEGRLSRLKRELEQLAARAESRDLFGEEAGEGPREREAREKLEVEVRALEEVLADVEAGRREGLAFGYGERFGGVMARGGFDLVVTNPPWVRATRVERGLRGLYRARYRVSEPGLWEGAAHAGVRATFGAQADLAALFVERSLELLKPGGRLVALVPGKVLRSLNGASLRRVLGEHELEGVEDRSEASAAMFEATTYPAVLRVRKGGGAGEVWRGVEVAIWRGKEVRRFTRRVEALGVWGAAAGEPWVLVDEEVLGLFRRMQARSVALGAAGLWEVRRGVMTGCNQAFLVESGAEPSGCFAGASSYLRPAVGGRDIGGEGQAGRRWLVWPVDAQGEVMRELPRGLRAHFEGYAGALKRRSDYREGQPLWQLYRVHADVLGPKVMWADLGQRLEAVASSGEEVPLNTVYYAGVRSEGEARALAAYLNSEPVRALAWALGERARGEWRRHFAWVVRLLPVPRAFVEAVVRGEGFEAWWEGGAFEEAWGLSGREVEVLRRYREGSGALTTREVA